MPNPARARPPFSSHWRHPRCRPCLRGVTRPPGLANGSTEQRQPARPPAREREVLTQFGERADLSPDDRRVAFMAKSFGDAFVIDLETRVIRCLTCGVPGAAFLRVMYLPSSDYLLIGPERFEDVGRSRSRDNELWFLSQSGLASPEARPPPDRGRGRLEAEHEDRVRGRPRAGPKHPRRPDADHGRGARSVGGPARAARRAGRLHERRARAAIPRPRTSSTRTASSATPATSPRAARASGRSTSGAASGSTSRAIGFYNEVEGIFPDGRYTCVESDHQSRVFGDPASFRNIDIWKLRLDGTGREFTRLTTFNDHEGWKASNPVVAPDGRFMAFQVARTATRPASATDSCGSTSTGRWSWAQVT